MQLNCRKINVDMLEVFCAILDNMNKLFDRPSIRVYGFEYVKYVWCVPKDSEIPAFYGFADQNVIHRNWYDFSPEIEITGPLANAVKTNKDRR